MDCSSLGSDAAVDEVALLQDALRDALERRRLYPSGALSLEQMSPAPAASCNFDAAVAAYGVQLKAWIDWHVDAHLRQVIPSVLDSELGAARQDCVVAVELAEHVESEARAVAAAQAKLLVVVEGISEELARLKAAVAKCQFSTMASASSQSRTTAGEEALIQIQSLRGAVEEMRRSVATPEQQSSSLEAVRRTMDAAATRQETLSADVKADLICLSEEVQLLRRQHAEVHNIRELVAEDRRQTVETIEQDLAPLLAHADEEARIGPRFEALRGEVARAVAAWADFEARLSSFGTELTARSEARLEVRLADLRLDDRFHSLRAELAEALEGQLTVQLEAARLSIEQAARGRLEDFRSRISDDVLALQDRTVKELRSETAAALSREAASIAALDEQLWITDQRLGQRIDELAHLHLRERVALAERSATPWGKRAETPVGMRPDGAASEPAGGVRRDLGSGEAGGYSKAVAGELGHRHPRGLAAPVATASTMAVSRSEAIADSDTESGTMGVARGGDARAARGWGRSSKLGVAPSREAPRALGRQLSSDDLGAAPGLPLSRLRRAAPAPRSVGSGHLDGSVLSGGSDATGGSSLGAGSSQR